MVHPTVNMYKYTTPPPPVDDSDSEILARDIPWETYMTARLISDKDLQLIRRYDKRPEELKASLLDENGPAFVEAFMSVLRSVTKEETVQYVLALLLQMLQANPARAKLFHSVGDLHMLSSADPYQVFLRLLQRQDWYTQEKACKLLALVVTSRPTKSHAFVNGVVAGGSDAASSSTGASKGAPDAAEPAITSFMDWLCGQLRRPSNPTKSVPTSVAALAVLLREKGCRVLLARAGGVQLVVPLLKGANSPTNSQLLYELCLCLWELSYYPQAAQAMATAGVSKGLVEVVKAAQKEKVVRVALLVLRNLLDNPGGEVASDMLEAGLPKVLVVRGQQSWGDEDIPELLTSLGERLKEGITVLSSFEKYKKEVLSGSLDWGPMHTSEVFWRQNVDKFEEKDFQVLRVLLKLLEASRENRTLAVGCNDLGKFIEFHPQGRYIVSDLRGKELVMRLLSHPDPEVQKRALMCVQKLMLSKDKLDFLQPASS